MIGGDAGSSLTHSTVELNQIQFLTNTLRVPLGLRASKRFSSLLPRPHYVKFNVDAMLRVDTKTRHEVFQIDRTSASRALMRLRASKTNSHCPDGQGRLHPTGANGRCPSQRRHDEQGT